MLADGCHAADVALPDETDTPSMIAARNQGAALIAQWVAEYNLAKSQVPMSNAANLFDLNYALGGYTQNVNDTFAGSGSPRTQALLQPTAEYSNSFEAI